MDTNNLRLISIWVNSDDEQCCGLLRYLRMCFGDQPASTVLIHAYSHFILPLLTSSLSKKVLSSLYVDDSLSAGRDKDNLEQSVTEVLKNWICSTSCQNICIVGSLLLRNEETKLWCSTRSGISKMTQFCPIAISISTEIPGGILRAPSSLLLRILAATA